MAYLLCLALFLPLAGFLNLILFSNCYSRRLTNLTACSTIFISFVCFAILLYFYNTEMVLAENITLFKWIPIKDINADFSLHVDSLSLLMALIITGIGFLIHVYSVGYIEHEEDYIRYFAFLNFFVFSMLLLVLAEHLLLLFVGWEGVGLASYLLIGFWYNRPLAAQAATKAFVMNRIGDLGFLIGLLLTFQLFGTGNITEILKRATEEFPVGAPIIAILTLLYFVGATGKSAQFPLYTWLPDAMEGPTPVSALIHAATMVTAGVYLVVRMHPLFMLAPITLQVIGIIGASTALFASLCALGQTNLKRVLAFSTVSQLGLMFLACSAGAFYSAMFHLTTHAFVKALLFLSAGNVVHMMHGSTDMNKMGGLAKIFTKTHWLFLIGVLALSGIPPLAAFFSKDLILEQEYLTGYKTLFFIGLAASLLTAFYLTRAYCLTFLGTSKTDSNTLGKLKEAPNIMLIPLFLLAALSIGGGFLGFSLIQIPILESFLTQIVGITPIEKELSTHLIITPETLLAMGGALIGVLTAGFVYTRFVERLGPTFQLLKKAFYMNEIYEKLFVTPLKMCSRFINNFLEPKIFDGFIQVTVGVARKASFLLQKVQSGEIRSYFAWMVLGTVLLIVHFVF